MGQPIEETNSSKDTSTTTASNDPSSTASNASSSNTQPSEQSTQQPNTSSSQEPRDPLPSSPSQLPPQALDLAAKLFDHARNGDTSVLREYLFAGIPPNLTNHAGDTLLMLASYHGHVDTVKMLLSKGADPNVTNERGQTIVAGAVFKGYEEVVKELVQKGADVRAGQPSAVDAGRMFKRAGCLRVMGLEDLAKDVEGDGGVGMPPGQTQGQG